jgi:hypothetical protein
VLAVYTACCNITRVQCAQTAYVFCRKWLESRQILLVYVGQFSVALCLSVRRMWRTALHAKWNSTTFSAFLFVRGLTIFFVVWASRKQNSLREFQISCHVTDVIRLDRGGSKSMTIKNTSLTWTKNSKYARYWAVTKVSLKRVGVCVSFRLQQSVGEILGAIFKSM